MLGLGARSLVAGGSRVRAFVRLCRPCWVECLLLLAGWVAGVVMLVGRILLKGICLSVPKLLLRRNETVRGRWCRYRCRNSCPAEFAEDAFLGRDATRFLFCQRQDAVVGDNVMAHLGYVTFSV